MRDEASGDRGPAVSSVASTPSGSPKKGRPCRRWNCQALACQGFLAQGCGVLEVPKGWLCREAGGTQAHPLSSPFSGKCAGGCDLPDNPEGCSLRSGTPRAATQPATAPSQSPRPTCLPSGPSSPGLQTPGPPRGGWPFAAGESHDLDHWWQFKEN